MIRRFRDSDVENVIRIWLAASVRAHDFIDRRFCESKADDMRDTYLPASEAHIHEDKEGVKGFLSLQGNTLAAPFVSRGSCGSGVRPSEQRFDDGRNILGASNVPPDGRRVACAVA